MTNTNADIAARATAATCAAIIRNTSETMLRSVLVGVARGSLSVEQLKQIHVAALALSAAAEVLCDASRAAGGEA